MRNEVSGVLAALAAPFFMALGFVIWDITWKTTGGSAFSLNLFKCNLASIGFLIMSLSLGFSDSSTANHEDGNDNDDLWKFESIGFLMLSGFIGVIVGDFAWLEALRILGASRVLVIDTIKPFAAVGFGWFILKESVNSIAYAGISLTVIGILIVNMGRERHDFHDINEVTKENSEDIEPCNDTRNTDNANGVQVQKYTSVRGYMFCICNIFLDTYGAILTKQHGVGMSIWAINLVRFGFSGVIMLGLSYIMRLYYRVKRKSIGDIGLDKETVHSEASVDHSRVPWYELPSMSRKSWIKMAVGVLFVTFICPALSNYALFQLSLALTLTLVSITPLYALILEWPFHGAEKKPTLISIIGALLAIGGVVILSIWNS